MTNSFWAGGRDVFVEGLRQRYEPQLDKLRKRRDDTDDTARAELDAMIERVETEYKAKLDSIGDSLF